jgi:hypothetical protein
MRRLLDLLKLDQRAPRKRRFFSAEPQPDRDAPRSSTLLRGYPADGADIESISEYRLASLVQYPHY